MKISRNRGLLVESIAAVLLLIVAGIGTPANAQSDPWPTGPPPLPSSLPVDPGELVATCCSGLTGDPGPDAMLDLDGYVVALFDVRNPDPLGVVSAGSTPFGRRNWRPPMFHNEFQSDANHIWNAHNLGQVFGLALDNAPNPNIYVTASTIYGEFEDLLNVPTTFGPGGSGAVYRLDGTTGLICTLAQLHNVNNDVNVGLGNVAFSPVGNFLYISNMDDGLIYRVPTSPCPNDPNTVYLTYDHGVAGRPEESLQPIPDNPSLRYTQLVRRVWAVEFNKNESRLYYSVWSEDSGRPNPTEDNEVWSVGLDANGAFIPNSAKREATHPPFLSDWSNPASDLSFTPAGNLMLAERTRWDNRGTRLTGGVNDSHQSRVLEFTGAHSNWTQNPENKYQVGNWLTNDNAAGGVVADCDENVWASADALYVDINFEPNIYGIQRIPSGGNMLDVPATLNSYLVDLDDDVGRLQWQVKTELGDVALNNVCCQDSAYLSDLIENNGIICSGEKMFCEFSYSPIGDMPPASDILVSAIDGGIRFQGTFVDLPGGGASDALIEFKVKAPDCFLVSSAQLAANPLAIGEGFFVVTETFLPTDVQTVLSVYDIQPAGVTRLLDQSDLMPPVQVLCVQKDIIAWALTDESLAVMSFIDQKFECIPDPDCDQDLDWGDLPEDSVMYFYGTTLANNGARHAIGGPFLGAFIDAEPDGIPSPNADGDDNLGVPNDEDGVILSACSDTGDIIADIVVNGGSGFLDAWMDIDGDGLFNNSNEKIFDNVPVSGSQTLISSGHQDEFGTDELYARFRISSAGGLQSTGFAPDGEVEDYRIILCFPSPEFDQKIQSFGQSNGLLQVPTEPEIAIPERIESPKPIAKSVLGDGK